MFFQNPLEVKDRQIWFPLFTTQSILTYMWHKNAPLISYLLRGLAQGCTQLQLVPFTLTSSLWMLSIGVVQCLNFIVVKGCTALYRLIFQLLFSWLTSALCRRISSNYFCYPEESWYYLVFLWSLCSQCQMQTLQFVHLTNSYLFFNALLRYQLYYKTFLVTSFSYHWP